MSPVGNSHREGAWPGGTARTNAALVAEFVAIRIGSESAPSTSGRFFLMKRMEPTIAEYRTVVFAG